MATILDPTDPPPFYSTFFANAVGYMLSTILPVRAGDIARPAPNVPSFSPLMPCAISCTGFKTARVGGNGKGVSCITGDRGIAEKAPLRYGTSGGKLWR